MPVKKDSWVELWAGLLIDNFISFKNIDGFFSLAPP